MLPLVIAPPKGKPARVLGLGREALPAVQSLTRVAWPLVVHDPEGARGLASFKGVQVTRGGPTGPLLRQASLVLVTSACPREWLTIAELELKDSDVPVWDAREKVPSSLLFPTWFPGPHLSVAVWGTRAMEPWEAALAEDLARASESLFSLFMKLAGELRALVFAGLAEDDFRQKVVGQLARPELLALLIRGQYEEAKMVALKIVGSTTRALE